MAAVIAGTPCISKKVSYPSNRKRPCVRNIHVVSNTGSLFYVVYFNIILFKYSRKSSINKLAAHLHQIFPDRLCDACKLWHNHLYKFLVK